VDVRGKKDIFNSFRIRRLSGAAEGRKKSLKSICIGVMARGAVPLQLDEGEKKGRLPTSLNGLLRGTRELLVGRERNIGEKQKMPSLERPSSLQGRTRPGENWKKPN